MINIYNDTTFDPTHITTGYKDTHNMVETPPTIDNIKDSQELIKKYSPSLLSPFSVKPPSIMFDKK